MFGRGRQRYEQAASDAFAELSDGEPISGPVAVTTGAGRDRAGERRRPARVAISPSGLYIAEGHLPRLIAMRYPTETFESWRLAPWVRKMRMLRWTPADTEVEFRQMMAGTELREATPAHASRLVKRFPSVIVLDGDVATVAELLTSVLGPPLDLPDERPRRF